MVVGLGAFVVALMVDSKRAWAGYLIGLFFSLSLALGGLFFTAIQHITKAGWSVNIRRLSEAFSAFLPVAFVLGLIFLIGSPQLYKWMDSAVVAKDPLLAHKAPYLNTVFFIIRVVVFFSLWIWFQRLIVGNSIKQDTTGDEALTVANLPNSIAFVLIFALSYSLFSVDTLMSAEPHWFSTIFGVYCFAGLFQSSLALLALFMIYGLKTGILKGFIDDNHLHDIGKFVFAFTVFWAYIAFSQYMLIWYANVPEETIFYIPRSEEAWAWLSISLIVFKFIVPFLTLLPRGSKRNPQILGAVCILILATQFLDLYWLLYPSLFKDGAGLPLLEALIFIGFFAAFLFVTARFLTRVHVIPIKDPRIAESLHHHVVY